MTASRMAVRSAVGDLWIRRLYIMGKYFATAFIMFLVNNEIFSLLLLLVISLFFWMDVYKARQS